MSSFDEITNNKKDSIIFQMPNARAIGKAIRTVPGVDDSLYKFFTEFKKEWMIGIKSLPNIAQDILFVIIDDYDEKTESFRNLVCILTPQDTEVPDGYDFKDISECECIVGKPGQDYSDLSCFIYDRGYEFITDVDQFWQAQIYAKLAKLTRILAPVRKIDFS
jgi:hypothetical protein